MRDEAYEPAVSRQSAVADRLDGIAARVSTRAQYLSALLDRVDL